MQKLLEDIEVVEIERGSTEKTIKIGSCLKKILKRRLVKCLRAHSNMFVWSYEDTSGIDPSVVYHKLV